MQITRMKECVGCAACEASCPTKAIQMKQLMERGGFCYPVIDEAKCILCKKCISVCTANKLASKNMPFRYEVVQNNDLQDLSTTTSGGATTSLAKLFVQKHNGIVYGAAFDSGMEVRHLRCETVVECDRLKGSKYVQSDLTSIHASIRKDLDAKRYVLFIGTPCQCASMAVFNNYSNFYMCDLVCNGVGSPEIFKKHIAYIEDKYKSKLSNYVFRPKTTRYLEPHELAIFTNQKAKLLVSPWEKWGTLYYNALVMRYSCYSCKFTSENRVGDITVSDIPKQLLNTCELKEVSRRGATYICVNTPKGNMLTELIHEQCSYTIADSVQTPRMKTSVSQSPLREAFMHICIERSLEKAKLRVFGRITKIKGILIKLKYNLGQLRRG